MGPDVNIASTPDFIKKGLSSLMLIHLLTPARSVLLVLAVVQGEDVSGGTAPHSPPLLHVQDPGLSPLRTHHPLPAPVELDL